MIIASCGHEISLGWHSDEKSTVEYKDFDDGKPVVVGAVFCEECRKKFARKKLIIKNKQEREDWLKCQNKK